MYKNIEIGSAVLGLLACLPLVAIAQSETNSQPHGEEATTSRWTSLPTDRDLRPEGYLRLDQDSHPGFLLAGEKPPLDLKSLLRPRVNFSAEWESEVDRLAIASYEISMQLPVYPIFGPPPPLITSGYSFTQIDAPAALDLPSSLHEFSLGLAWLRRINENWMARFMFSGAFASDLDNTSSDAWQLRAGAFAMYRPNDRWSFAFGALVTGRDDIPVIPAIGAIWEPSPEIKFDLMMPKPRISFLLVDTPERQHWGYFGGGISGGTWAYDRASGLGDRLSYREWRLVLGWESKRPQSRGAFRPSGKTLNVEVGYVFGREFEFSSPTPAISIGDALLLRAAIRF